MQWSEIDFDQAVWTIPAGRMKMREPHHVPLSKQALDLLRKIQTLTANGTYVFPSIRSASRPMSENTVNGALRRMGYGGDEMTAHGFRSTASSLLNESGGGILTQLSERWHIARRIKCEPRIIARSIGQSGSRWLNGGATIWTSCTRARTSCRCAA
jgi:integrase